MDLTCHDCGGPCTCGDLLRRMGRTAEPRPRAGSKLRAYQASKVTPPTREDPPVDNVIDGPFSPRGGIK